MKADLGGVIAEIKSGGGPQLLLLFGDDVQVQEACGTIVDLLVPRDYRGFNLERFDGRVVEWDRIEASLFTPPFCPGRKVLWIENARYFLPREQKSELVEKLFQLWREGKQEEASRRFIDLLIVEGWIQEQWERNEWSSTQGVAELLGVGDGEMRREVEAILSYCRAKPVDLSRRRIAQKHGLADLLERGVPEWNVLLLTATQVDRRTRLFKGFEEKGVVLDLNLERDRSGRISRESLLDWLNRRLRREGKTLPPQAREMILSRAGDDLRGVALELDKLLLFVGDRRSVTAEDVAEIFDDRGESWVFDLTRAMAERNAKAALARLGRLMAQGEHPLKLLATVAAEARRLLCARHLLDGDLKGLWKRDLSYQQFQYLVLKHGLPSLTRNPYADYLCFQRAGGFSLKELRRFMNDMFEADFRLKSSSSNPRITMERLILGLCLESEKVLISPERGAEA
jgi:DNA polymerase-3 subunit delta